MKITKTKASSAKTDTNNESENKVPLTPVVHGNIFYHFLHKMVTESLTRWWQLRLELGQCTTTSQSRSWTCSSARSALRMMATFKQKQDPEWRDAFVVLLDWIRLSTCTCSDTYQPEDDHIYSIYIYINISPSMWVPFHTISADYVYIYIL